MVVPSWEGAGDCPQAPDQCGEADLESVIGGMVRPGQAPGQLRVRGLLLCGELHVGGVGHQRGAEDEVLDRECHLPRERRIPAAS